MKKLLVVVLVLLVGVTALSYWRGWFSVTNDPWGGVQVDPAKFKQDKEAVSKTVGEKAKALKAKIASLWKKSERLTGDDKAHAKKDLAELEKKHERIEKQLEELKDADQDRFGSIKEDLSKDLEEVEKKTEELTEKLEKGKDK